MREHPEAFPGSTPAAAAAAAGGSADTPAAAVRQGLTFEQPGSPAGADGKPGAFHSAPAASTAAADEMAEEERAALLEQQHRFGTTGFAHASLFARFTYAFVSPLVRLGARNKVGVVWWGWVR